MKKALKIGGCIIAERQSRRRVDWKPSLELMRLREVEAVIRARHGSQIPDTDDGDIYVRAAAFAKSEQDMTAWCAKWAPWMQPADIADIVAEACRRRRMMRADGVAGLLLVTMEERTRLRLKTIGACDMSTDDRKGLARDKKRERDRKRQAALRAPAIRQNRQSYEAQSAERLKPWEASGMSRRTWYRRRGTSTSRVDIYTNGDIPVPTDYAPPVPAIPRLSSRPATATNTDGNAGREGVRGPSPRRGSQGAEPHGSRDKKSEAAA